MLVKIIASTTLHYALEETGYIRQRDYMDSSEPDFGSDEWEAWADRAYPCPIDELHEAAGRECYQSWHRPNPATESNAGYLGHIIEVEHESVLGHGHVTFAVRGVSRALLLELERHQQRYSINFSVMSQRYVNHGLGTDIEVVIPPLFTEDQTKDLKAAFLYAQHMYDKTYREMRDAEHSVKEARGAARAFLPESTETRYFVTGSIRAWRNIIEQRLTDQADAEIREFARLVLTELATVAPNSMQDQIRQHSIEVAQ